MNRELRIGIVDDQTLFLEGLSELLNNQPGIKVKVVAKDGNDLLKRIRYEEVDVVLIDYKMPGLDGIETSRLVHQENPEIKILLLSMYNDQDLIIKSIQNGARGFIHKNITIQEMVQAINDVIDQGYYADQKTTEDLIQSFFTSGKSIGDLDSSNQFSNMELEVIRLICDELSTKEIADKIYRGVRTVEGIRSNILKKTGAKNSNGIVMYAIRNGIVDL